MWQRICSCNSGCSVVHMWVKPCPINNSLLNIFHILTKRLKSKTLSVDCLTNGRLALFFYRTSHSLLLIRMCSLIELTIRNIGEWNICYFRNFFPRKYSQIASEGKQILAFWPFLHVVSHDNSLKTISC